MANSLRECVNCRDNKDVYLLPCLHAMCTKCVEKVVLEASQKDKKLPTCFDCGEPFVKEKLASVPCKHASSPSCFFDCVEVVTHYCGDCKKHMCRVHTEGHRLSKPTQSHSLQLFAEVSFCHKHTTETALGLCTHCNLLVCGRCGIEEHNKLPHVSISLEVDAIKMTDCLKNDIRKLLEFIPIINNEIKKCTSVRSKLEQDRAELEGKIVDISKQEKVKTLQIDDLENLKRMLHDAQMQVNALAVAATVIPHSLLLHLRKTVIERLSQLQIGVDLTSRLISSPDFTLPVTTFNRVHAQHLKVSNSGKTVTSTTQYDWGYAISDDGCSRGSRSWRITINAVSDAQVMLGIWNSKKTPTNNYSYEGLDAWIVYSYTSGPCIYKAGILNNLNSPAPYCSGDDVLLTVDCDKRCLTVHNTTQGWTHTIEQLPPPNPAYFPHVLLYNENDSVTIEAVA